MVPYKPQICILATSLEIQKIKKEKKCFFFHATLVLCVPCNQLENEITKIFEHNQNLWTLGLKLLVQC